MEYPYPRNTVWLIEARVRRDANENPAAGSAVVISLRRDNGDARKYLLTCAHVVKDYVAGPEDRNIGVGPTRGEILCWPPGEGFVKWDGKSRWPSDENDGIWTARVMDVFNRPPDDWSSEDCADERDWVLLDVFEPSFQQYPESLFHNAENTESPFSIIGYLNGSIGLRNGRNVQSKVSPGFEKYRTDENPAIMRPEGSWPTGPGMSGGGVFDPHGDLIGLYRGQEKSNLSTVAVKIHEIRTKLWQREKLGGFDAPLKEQTGTVEEKAVRVLRDEFLIADSYREVKTVKKHIEGYLQGNPASSEAQTLLTDVRKTLDSFSATRRAYLIAGTCMVLVLVAGFMFFFRQPLPSGFANFSEFKSAYQRAQSDPRYLPKLVELFEKNEVTINWDEIKIVETEPLSDGTGYYLCGDDSLKLRMKINNHFHKSAQNRKLRGLLGTLVYERDGEEFFIVLDEEEDTPYREFVAEPLHTFFSRSQNEDFAPEDYHLVYVENWIASDINQLNQTTLFLTDVRSGEFNVFLQFDEGVPDDFNPGTQFSGFAFSFDNQSITIRVSEYQRNE